MMPVHCAQWRRAGRYLHEWANKEEAEIDVLEHIKSSEKAQKGKNIGILVLSIAVVSLKIECVERLEDK